MQWPPTKPGVKFKKFHLVPAAFSTSWVSIPILLKITANSLIKAILMSLWVFSMTFAASAVFIEGALYIPASIMDPYRFASASSVSGVDPETTLVIFVMVCFLSPGLMRSGL